MKIECGQEAEQRLTIRSNSRSRLRTLYVREILSSKVLAPHMICCFSLNAIQSQP